MNLNPDTLSGRALDAAVARDVFGLEVEERNNARTGERDFVCREPGKQWVRVPFYTSLTASLNLTTKLVHLGWTAKPAPLRRQADASGVARVVLASGEREVEGTGQSFEEALCRAALMAVRG